MWEAIRAVISRRKDKQGIQFVIDIMKCIYLYDEIVIDAMSCPIKVKSKTIELKVHTSF